MNYYYLKTQMLKTTKNNIGLITIFIMCSQVCSKIQILVPESKKICNKFIHLFNFHVLSQMKKHVAHRDENITKKFVKCQVYCTKMSINFLLDYFVRPYFLFNLRIKYNVIFIFSFL